MKCYNLAYCLRSVLLSCILQKLSVLYLYSESLTGSTQFITAHQWIRTELSLFLPHYPPVSILLIFHVLFVISCGFYYFVQSWFYPLSYVWEWRWCNGKSKQYVIYKDFLEKAYSVALLRCIFSPSCGHINTSVHPHRCV